MYHIELENIELQELMPGFWGRLVHSEHVTIAYWQIEAGAELKLHAHPHEQIVNVLTGKFELTVEGIVRVLEEGSIVIIPGDTPHAGRAISNCEVIDVFHPVRSDYQ